VQAVAFTIVIFVFMPTFNINKDIIVLASVNTSGVFPRGADHQVLLIVRIYPAAETLSGDGSSVGAPQDFWQNKLDDFSAIQRAQRPAELFLSVHCRFCNFSAYVR